ncbi:hypothetical protein TRSC58_06823 [Trypanosoma rangeli SC58]|uniref:Uncharacterized protein n=1 Tax=Trypanosoma rangeli SC58 TaxID=429131 RepID=A0A061IUJ1_TRYRA|nr:hypothetical protein TRSC58_06823 [Trypanosoma rangeli SC58]
MFMVLRCFFTSIMFNMGAVYAVFLSLRVPSGAVTGKEYTNELQDKANISPYALKLWIMITFFASFSYLGADNLPLFMETRVVLMWFLLLLPPVSQSKVYDSTFEPVLEKIWKNIIEFEGKRTFARSAAILALRGCIWMGVCIARLIMRYWDVEEDSIHRVLESLQHASGCLQDTVVRRPDTVTFSASSSLVLQGLASI